jgi:hypothetical protein
MDSATVEQWKRRAEEIARKSPINQRDASEAIQCATSMLTAVYGPKSPQLAQFVGDCKTANVRLGGPFLVALGAIQNVLAELEGGLILRLRVALAGEVLSDLIRLAKAVLEERTATSQNVGAVLVAAAYEALIRRMSEEFAGVVDRPKLEEVIGRLKDAGILQGAQVGIAQSYLKFRNDALHADWKNIDRTQAESCLAFIESLLSKHFG